MIVIATVFRFRISQAIFMVDELHTLEFRICQGIVLDKLHIEIVKPKNPKTHRKEITFFY